MTEQLAPGRFSWCKLRVRYRDLSIVDEDRSDGSWWDKLSKKDITGLSIIPLDNNGNEVIGKRVGLHISPESIRRVGFFHYKQARKTFGLMSDTMKYEEIGYVIGMVTSPDGNAITLQMKPDYSTERHDINVITTFLNLEQQGIVLNEIDGE